MKLLNLCIAAFALATALCPVVQAAQVTVEGAVISPGRYNGAAEIRLADILIAAQPRSNAYLLGASLNRETAKSRQAALKAGILHTLADIQTHKSLQVRTAAQGLSDWIESRDVTGRIPMSADLRLMQLQPRTNPEAIDGDRVYIPTRPDSVLVVGVVGSPCKLLHAAQKDAAAYARECKSLSVADANYIYAIQADGAVQKLGIAGWNRSDLQAVSPGGTVFVPMSESIAQRFDSELNNEIAEFIATQPIEP